jgi:hypothetical protein
VSIHILYILGVASKCSDMPHCLLVVQLLLPVLMPFYMWSCLQITYAMVKAVVVLASSEGVKGTIHFTQEGDGKSSHIL